MLGDGVRFLAAMVLTLLPFRLWARLPAWMPVESAAFIAGISTLFGGMAVGIPGFLEHATGNVSLANATLLEAADRNIMGYSRGMASGFGALSIFSFLLLTPKGWLTSYLVVTGGVRAGAAWFDDPIGDPVLTVLDYVLWRGRERRQAKNRQETRAALEGPEFADRIISAAKADIPGCDLVIVSSRRKPGWARDVVVYTATTCYRIGDPVERTIAGNLRTLYPLTEHTDLEAVRKSVNYDMPDAHSRH